MNSLDIFFPLRVLKFDLFYMDIKNNFSRSQHITMIELKQELFLFWYLDTGKQEVSVSVSGHKSTGFESLSRERLTEYMPLTEYMNLSCLVLAGTTGCWD